MFKFYSKIWLQNFFENLSQNLCNMKFNWAKNNRLQYAIMPYYLHDNKLTMPPAVWERHGIHSAIRWIPTASACDCHAGGWCGKGLAECDRHMTRTPCWTHSTHHIPLGFLLASNRVMCLLLFVFTLRSLIFIFYFHVVLLSCWYTVITCGRCIDFYRATANKLDSSKSFAQVLKYRYLCLSSNLHAWKYFIMYKHFLHLCKNICVKKLFL